MCLIFPYWLDSDCSSPTLVWPPHLHSDVISIWNASPPGWSCNSTTPHSLHWSLFLQAYFQRRLLFLSPPPLFFSGLPDPLVPVLVSRYFLWLHAGLDLQGWIFRVGVFLSALCLHRGKMVLEFGCIGPGIIWPLSVINTNIKLSTMFTKHNIKTIKYLYNRILKW